MKAPIFALLILSLCAPCRAAVLRGDVVDRRTGAPLPCRIYVRGEDGTWHFPRSAAKEGTAFTYKKQNWSNARSVEMHTTLSAHPFELELPEGAYAVTVERGKEYLPLVETVKVGEEPVTVRLELSRWIDMASRGWYSGDTHVHRTLEELPNVMLAEDLNVSFPLLYWVHDAFTAPAESTREAVAPEVIPIDGTHVIYPVNTEYEIFQVGGKRHTLGAFFVLDHRTPFTEGVPPLAGVLEKARREGGLFELDKHAWPWSMALVPILDVDLYELANNHVWRTEFAFRDFGEPPGEYMEIEKDERGMTERGWIQYGLRNYYSLLNCGFRIRPTAGTACGVHPVPLGFGRVYVHLEGGFDYRAWVRGLDEGRSFVTTGPMLFVKVEGELPGHSFRQEGGAAKTYRISGSALSPYAIDGIEVIVNGELRTVAESTDVEIPVAGSERTVTQASITAGVEVDSTSWIAVRCFAHTADGRIRFAHTGPFHVFVEGRPLRPRRAEVEYLIDRVEKEIARSRGTLPEAAIAEYEKALEAYRRIAKSAR